MLCCYFQGLICLKWLPFKELRSRGKSLKKSRTTKKKVKKSYKSQKVTYKKSLESH